MSGRCTRADTCSLKIKIKIKSKFSISILKKGYNNESEIEYIPLGDYKMKPNTLCMKQQLIAASLYQRVCECPNMLRTLGEDVMNF